MWVYISIKKTPNPRVFCLSFFVDVFCVFLPSTALLKKTLQLPQVTTP